MFMMAVGGSTDIVNRTCRWSRRQGRRRGRFGSGSLCFLRKTGRLWLTEDTSQALCVEVLEARGLCMGPRRLTRVCVA